MRRDHNFERTNAYDAAINQEKIEEFLRRYHECDNGVDAEWLYAFGHHIARAERDRLRELREYTERFTEPRQRAILRRAYFLKNDHLFAIGLNIANKELGLE